MLTEEFITAKLEEFPQYGNRHTNTKDKEELEELRFLVGLEIDEAIVADNCRERTGCAVNNLVVEWNIFIEVEANAETQGDKEEDIIYHLNTERNTYLEEFFDNWHQEWKTEPRENTAPLVVVRIDENPDKEKYRERNKTSSDNI